MVQACETASVNCTNENGSQISSGSDGRSPFTGAIVRIDFPVKLGLSRSVKDRHATQQTYLVKSKPPQ
jgi:hypothetical protein